MTTTSQSSGRTGSHRGWWIVIMAAICLPLACLLLLVALPLCQDTSSPDERSPDDRYRAYIEQSNCGATTPSISRVMIMERSLPLLPFVRSGATLLTFRGDKSYAAIRWSDPDHLVIRYAGDCQHISGRTSTWRDIQVIHEGPCATSD